MEEQVYSTQSRQESINQITKVVNDDAIPTKSRIRYSEERKREWEWKMGWKVRSEKDMNKSSMRWSVVVSVMTI